jgi:hypothetical protein
MKRLKVTEFGLDHEDSRRQIEDLSSLKTPGIEHDVIEIHDHLGLIVTPAPGKEVLPGQVTHFIFTDKEGFQIIPLPEPKLEFLPNTPTVTQTSVPNGYG